MANQEILVPDMGGSEGAEVIEITIAVGDNINVDDTLAVVESDKATVDIPSPYAGKISEIKINVGDKISEGTLIAMIESGTSEEDSEAADDSEDKKEEKAQTDEVAETNSDSKASSEPESKHESNAEQKEANQSSNDSASEIEEIKVPDIGGSDEVEVIEVLIKSGDSIDTDQGLITLESDKATMDVPSVVKGVIENVNISVGDKVKEGSVIATIKTSTSKTSETAKDTQQETSKSSNTDSDNKKEESKASTKESAQSSDSKESSTTNSTPNKPAPLTMPLSPTANQAKAHASPGVRKFARELGADITQVPGTASKNRITKEDVKTYIKLQLSNVSNQQTAASSSSGNMGIEPIPTIDFSQFGEIEEQALSRIKKISGPHLSRSWLNVPHVTHHDEFDITELENFRKSIKDEAAKQDVRITLLAFVTQALTKALQKFPTFNSSLSPDGASLILKKYINIGIAVDTPNGLMVPNIKDCDKKSAYDLANDMMAISLAARDGKIKPDMLKGGTFSISSLGGIGGTAFTPIVNAPEVAILGITRSQMKPIWNGKEFVPKLMIPLDLSYDHRAIDGAEAARFMSYLGQLLADPKRLLL